MMLAEGGLIPESPPFSQRSDSEEGGRAAVSTVFP